MLICPYCQLPFAMRRELATHIKIKHQGALSNLLQQIQNEHAVAQIDDELLDDGVYIGDTVIHAPHDDDDWLEKYDYTEGDIGQDGEI